VGPRDNSRRAQVYRYLASRVDKTVHVDALAKYLGLPMDAKGIQKARRPIYDLIDKGEVELETISAGGVWKVLAVIGEEDGVPVVQETPEPEQQDAAEVVTFDLVGKSLDAGTPIVRDATGRVYRLVRI
jgi:hypothetical protein